MHAGGRSIPEPDLDVVDRGEGIQDPVVLRYAVWAYLVALPVGHLYTVSVFGTVATLSDGFLAIVILAGFAEIDRMIPRYLARRKEP